MKRDYCMIIKNALTGEQIKIDNAQELSTQAKNSIIEAYTEKWTNNNIGYYISYMYEM